MQVKVRIDGSSEDVVRKAADKLGVKLSAVYAKRDDEGYYGYGRVDLDIETKSKKAVAKKSIRDFEDDEEDEEYKEIPF